MKTCSGTPAKAGDLVQTARTTDDVVLALRCFLSFATSTFYRKVVNELYFNFFVGDKSQFQAPVWYAPQGGGIHGYDSTTHFLTNGVPSHEAILKLAKPVPIPARQHFRVGMSAHSCREARAN